MAKQAMDKQELVAKQAMFLDDARVGLADPDFGCPIPPACVFSVFHGHDGFSCVAEEHDSFARFQEEHPDGLWGICIGKGHDYDSNWSSDFDNVLVPAYEAGIIDRQCTKIGVVFAAHHGGPEGLDEQRKELGVPVIAEYTGPIFSVPWEKTAAGRILEKKRKLRERLELVDHAPRGI